MIAIGFILDLAGLGVFCWLLFTLAGYALPLFVEVTAGLHAYQAGAGLLGSVSLALVVGSACLAAARIFFAGTRMSLIRATIALLFAAPAALAGFSASHGLAAFTMSSETWQNVFGVVGAIVIGATAWRRLADASFERRASGVDRDGARHRGLTSM